MMHLLNAICVRLIYTIYTLLQLFGLCFVYIADKKIK